jgi:hypothetical protein
MKRAGKLVDPRAAVIRRLAAAYDKFAEEEQELAGLGWYERSTIAHGYCLIVLRAYRAELDDPTPEGL